MRYAVIMCISEAKDLPSQSCLILDTKLGRGTYWFALGSNLSFRPVDNKYKDVYTSPERFLERIFEGRPEWAGKVIFVGYISHPDELEFLQSTHPELFI